MFTHDLVKASYFNRKHDGEQTFQTWCARVGIDASQYPYEAKSFKFYKNRAIVFKVMSWGSYQNADGQWIVFVAYQFAPMKHTIQYRWYCNPDGMAEGEAAKFEWVN
jgi:hypothetical protein